MDEFEYRIPLKILGAIIEVRCVFSECLEGIKSFFSTFEVSNEITPDIIIYCNWAKSDRYLYRTRPEIKGDNSSELGGVFYQLRGESQIHSWKSLNPPLIPFELAPLENQFIAIHAGAIKNEKNEGILFIGKSGSGKTTSTLRLVEQNKNLKFLTDETVFCRNRSVFIEPFQRTILPRKEQDGEIIKTSVPAIEAISKEKIAVDGAIAKYLIFLEHLPGKTPLGIKEMSKEESFKKIVEHYQFAGADISNAMITLKYIVDNAKSYNFEYSNYVELIDFLDDFEVNIKTTSPKDRRLPAANVKG